jgi:hypothetical protein
MMSEDEMVFGNLGFRLEELDTGTEREGIQVASKGYLYGHWTIRLLGRCIHDVSGHVRCTGMKNVLCPD